MLRVVQEHGDIVRLSFGPVPVHFLWHPDGVRRVTVDNHRNYSKKAPGHSTLRRLIGDGLITSDGELWRNQRRIIQPAFKKERLQPLAPSMAKAAREMIDRWQGDADVDIAVEMTHVSLRIACETLLGASLENMEEFASAAGVACADISDQITSPTRLPLWVPTPQNRAFNAALRVIDATVARTIEKPARGDDMLSLLLEAEMEPKQLRDELVTMLLAGHETTAGTLMWTLWLLAKHPDIRARVEEEIDRGGSDLLERVIKESLRLWPIVWNVARHVEEDDEVLGCRVPKGTVLCLTPYISHRNPAFWPEPDVFDPDRFLPENEKDRPRGAYIPFLAGPRACIGAGLAMLETIVVLTEVMSRFRLDMATGCETEPIFRFTIRPSGPLLMRPTPRDRS